MIKAISFDLQGTLSQSRYSDLFWLEILPGLYAGKKNLPPETAKKELGQFFKQIGKYDSRYYDNRYWEQILNFNTVEVMKNHQPCLNEKLLHFALSLNIPKYIFSTTTHDFMNLELGCFKKNFNDCFSSLDFNIAGKSKEAYIRFAKEINCKTNEILHVGDNIEMDITNAESAGLNTILFAGSEEEVIEKIRQLLKL